MSSPTVNFFIQTRQVQFAVPTELVKKNLKSIQKLIEKARKLLVDEVSKVRKSDMTAEQKLATIRKMIRLFEQTLRKLHLLKDRDAEYRDRLAARVARLSQLREYTIKGRNGDDTDGDDGDLELDFHKDEFVNWLRDEANILVIDYLLKSNMLTRCNVGSVIAEKMGRIAQAPIQRLVDCDVYENYNQVYLSITEKNDLELITAWYSDNRNALKKIGLNLQFEIHYCRFLYLLKQGQTYEAIEYSKSNLAPYAQLLSYSPEEEVNYPLNLERLSEVGAPLASIVSNTESRSSTASYFLLTMEPSRPSKYLHNNQKQAELRWMHLGECFTRDFTRIFGISHTYPFLVYLSAGLSCLKSKLCYCNKSNTIFVTKEADEEKKAKETRSDKDLLFRGPNYYYNKLKKVNQCPVCSPELFALSRSLPYGLLITSIFNDPVMLPNGNIYSNERLKQHMVPSTPKSLQDPLTKENFIVSDCVKVFPA